MISPSGYRCRVARLALTCCLLGSVLYVGSASAQSVWELTPYRVRIIVATADNGRLPPEHAQELGARIVDRLDSLVGATWLIETVVAEGALRHLVLEHFSDVAKENLPPDALEDDKVVLVAIAADSQGTLVRTREFDVRTELWSTSVERRIAQPRPLVNDVVRAIVDGFAPLAEIEKVDGKKVSLTLRAAALATRDPSLALVAPDDIFRPVVRQNERDGSARKIQPVIWTYILVGEVANAHAEGTVYSGMRSPLAARRRGRTEQLALAVHPPRGTTRLTLHSRTAPIRPLPGYEVYAYGPNDKTTVLLGRSDATGSVEVPPGPQALRIVVVKSGSEFLARLPIVPGLEASIEAPVAPDDERVAAEGFIIGLQEELVDLVVRREVLIALVRARLADGNLEEADRLNDELSELRTRDQFALLLDAQKQRMVSSDQVVQKKIDRLFTDTLQLVNNFMASGPVEELQAELRQAKGGAVPAEAPVEAPAAPAGTPAATPAPAKPTGAAALESLLQEAEPAKEAPAAPAEANPAAPPSGAQ